MLVQRSTLSITVVLLFLSIIVKGQNFDPIDIPFEKDGLVLDNPLIGGLLAPQFVSFDLDGQGPEDLIVFERNGDIILPFINNSSPGNPSYKYAPEYSEFFPQLLNYVQLIDFNEDGKKDIFSISRVASALEVYRNTSENGVISFELMEFNFGLGDFLQFPVGGGYSQVYVSNIDIPAIVDEDGDGDLDILTFEAGGSKMYLFQNMVKELDLPVDTFVYKLNSLCWGRFHESDSSEEIIISDNISDCAQGFQSGKGEVQERHAGSTVLAFDGDGDGDLDMVLGDLTNTGLEYLVNDPVESVAYIVDQDKEFPSNSEEVQMNIFLGAFFIDIDNDGKRDLIAAPNNELSSQNINHVWYYRNMGEDNSPVFELVQKNFLVGGSLEMGQSSYPCFLDFNEDGLQDLLVGNNGIIDGDEKVSSLFLYENIGTSTEPAYRLVTDDYLNLKLVVDELNGFLAPTAGDLDGDGDTDIIVGDKRGYLFYFENTAGAGQTYSFDNYVYQYMDIKPGSNSKPSIQDMDGDGLMDIIVGEVNSNTNPNTGVFGSLNYFRNIGSVGNPNFNPIVTEGDNNNTLGNVYTKYPGTTKSSASPNFVMSEGELLMLTGSSGGNIYAFDDIEGNAYDSFNEIYSDLPILNIGRRTVPALADIDGDDYYEIIAGNDNGGLRAFNTIFKVVGSTNTEENHLSEVVLYPNPAGDILNVVIGYSEQIEYNIFDLNGRVVSTGQNTSNHLTIDIVNLEDGMYTIVIKGQEYFSTAKFVKISK